MINENADLVAINHRYVMRITGNDKDGLDQLGNFIESDARPTQQVSQAVFMLQRFTEQALGMAGRQNARMNPGRFQPFGFT